MGKAKAKNGSVQEIATGGVTWINVTKPTMGALRSLRKRFPPLLDIDLKDCLPPYQRPKLLERDAYLFLVLLFPWYDGTTRTIRPYEVDFFIGPDFLISSHEGGHEVLERMAKDCTTGGTCVVARNGSPLGLLSDILHSLVISGFPMITRISNDLVSLEKRLFVESDDEVVRDILRVRTDIVDFRLAVQGYDNAVRKLLDRGRKFFPVDDLRPQFEDIAGHGREITEFLQTDRDTVDALYDSHLTLVTYRTNRATKTLTGLAFVIFPMTLVAAIFSMRAEHMPFVGEPNDFWIMLGCIFATMLVLVLYLRKKKLL